MEQKHPDEEYLGRLAKFDPGKHGVICEELKMFYTALTRARVNVVIHDESEEKRRPMFELLAALNLVRVFDSSSTDSISAEIDLDGAQKNRGMAVSSSKEEWKRRGDNLLANKLYAQAEICYKKSGSKTLEHRSKGHRLVGAAKRSDETGRKELLKEAAECFLLGDWPTEAAKCLAHARHHELAADIWESLNDWEQAGKLYRKASRIDGETRDRRRMLGKIGAQKFESGGLFREALLLLQGCNAFVECIDLLDRHSDFVPQDDISRGQFARSACDMCLGVGDYDGMLSNLQVLSEDEQLSYLLSKEKRLTTHLGSQDKVLAKKKANTRDISAAGTESALLAAKANRDVDTLKLERVVSAQVNILVKAGRLSKAAGKLASIGDLDGAAGVLLKSDSKVEMDEAAQIKLQRLRDCGSYNDLDSVVSTFQHRQEKTFLDSVISAYRQVVEVFAQTGRGGTGAAGVALADLVFAKVQSDDGLLQDAQLKFKKLGSRYGVLAAVNARLDRASLFPLAEQILIRTELVGLYHVARAEQVNVHDCYLMVRTNAAGQSYIHATNFTCLEYMQAGGNDVVVTFPHTIIQRHLVIEAIEADTKRAFAALIKATLSFAAQHIEGSVDADELFRLKELVVYCRHISYCHEVPSRRPGRNISRLPQAPHEIRDWRANHEHWLSLLTKSCSSLFDEHYHTTPQCSGAKLSSLKRCLDCVQIRTAFKFQFWLQFDIAYQTIWKCQTPRDPHAFISTTHTLQLFRLASMANLQTTFRRWLITVERELYPSISFLGSLHGKPLYEAAPQAYPALPVSP